MAQQQLEQLRQKLVRQQQEFESYKKQCEILQKYLEEQATKKQGQIRVLKQQAIKRQKNLSLTKTELSALQGQNRQLKNIIKEFQQKEKELQSKCKQLQAQLKSYKGNDKPQNSQPDVVLNKDKPKSKEVDMQVQEQKEKQRQKQRQAQRQRQKQRQAERQQQKQKLQLKIALLQGQIQQSNKRLTNAQQQAQLNKQQKQASETKYKQVIYRNSDQILKLKEAVKQKQGCIQHMQKQIQDLNSQISNLSSSLSTLNNHLSSGSQTNANTNTSITINSSKPAGSNPSGHKSKNKTQKTLQITIEKTTTKNSPVPLLPTTSFKQQQYLELKQMYKIKQNQLASMAEKVNQYKDLIKDYELNIIKLQQQLQEVHQNTHAQLQFETKQQVQPILQTHKASKQKQIRNTKKQKSGLATIKSSYNSPSTYRNKQMIAQSQIRHSNVEYLNQSEQDPVQQRSGRFFSPSYQHNKRFQTENYQSASPNRNAKGSQYSFSLYMTTKNYYKIPFIEFLDKTKLKLYKLDKNGKIDKTMGFFSYKFNSITFNMDQIINKAAYSACNIYNQSKEVDRRTKVVICGAAKTGKKMLMGGIISKVKDYIFGKLSENSNTSHSPMNPNTSNHSMAHNSNVNIRRSHSYSYEEEYEGDNSHVQDRDSRVNSMGMNMNIWVRYLQIQQNEMINIHLESRNKGEVIRIIQNLQRQSKGRPDESSGKKQKQGHRHKQIEISNSHRQNQQKVRYFLLEIDDYQLQIITKIKQNENISAVLDKLAYSKIPEYQNKPIQNTQIILTVNPIVKLYEQCKQTLKLVNFKRSHLNYSQKTNINVFDYKQDNAIGHIRHIREVINQNQSTYLDSFRQSKQAQKQIESITIHRLNQRIEYYKTKLKELLLQVKVMLNTTSQVSYLKKPPMVLNLQKILRTIQMLINQGHNQSHFQSANQNNNSFNNTAEKTQRIKHN